ncbi:hypothetical protein HDU76_012837 [Blyttiomyces sp. JEL0837]|nr:hypothetical protein HDU76_012837 [Blyttiomyces sp. JEL0837]
MSSPSQPISTEDDDLDQYQIPTVWAAFDKLQLCYTVIPQVKHYYRYGTLRDCTEARKDFTFAMSIKSKNRTEALRLVKEREEMKYHKKVAERPSIGVWELRTEPPPDFPPKV